MSTRAHPPIYPPLRAARPSDIPRIGTVITSSFSHSPVIPWQRPYQAQYPADTLAYYRQSVADYLRSPNHMVIVAVDKRVRGERAKTRLTAFPPEEKEEDEGDEGEEVVVAVAAWEIPEGSVGSGIGGEVKAESFPLLEPCLFRDRHQGHYDALGAKVRAAAERVAPPHPGKLYIVATHPAYWRRGHGSALVKWGLEVALADNVPQTVVGPAIGMRLYRALGFEARAQIEMEGDKVTPQGLTVWLAVYDPKGK